MDALLGLKVPLRSIKYPDQLTKFQRPGRIPSQGVDGDILNVCVTQLLEVDQSARLVVSGLLRRILH